MSSPKSPSAHFRLILDGQRHEAVVLCDVSLEDVGAEAEDSLESRAI